MQQFPRDRTNHTQCNKEDVRDEYLQNLAR
jgi:hypothetical protein